MSPAGEPQVAWKVVEPGAALVTADGQEAGRVTRIVGDADADVFTGIAFKHGLLGREQLVPSERVRGIWTDRVEVDLTGAELGGLPRYEDNPSVRIEPAAAGFFSRLFGRR